MKIANVMNNNVSTGTVAGWARSRYMWRGALKRPVTPIRWKPTFEIIQFKIIHVKTNKNYCAQGARDSGLDSEACPPVRAS